MAWANKPNPPPRRPREASRTTNYYDYHNGAVQDRIIYDSDIHDSSNAIHNTYFNYHEVAGTTHLDFVDVVDGNAHRIKYNTDINGQIVNRGPCRGLFRVDLIPQIKSWNRMNGLSPIHPTHPLQSL